MHAREVSRKIDWNTEDFSSWPPVNQLRFVKVISAINFLALPISLAQG